VAHEIMPGRADFLERRGFELMAIARCRSSDPNRWRNKTLPSPSPFTPKPIRAVNLAPKARRFDPSGNHPWLASVLDAHEGSPAPNGGSAGRSTSSITISGTSGKVRVGGRPRRCEDDEGKRKFLCCWLNNLFDASPNRIPRTPAYGVI
jgi:hypothetical protein